MSMGIHDLYEVGESNCCGARVLTPDVCADCYEHCGVVNNNENEGE